MPAVAIDADTSFAHNVMSGQQNQSACAVAASSSSTPGNAATAIIQLLATTRAR